MSELMLVPMTIEVPVNQIACGKTGCTEPPVNMAVGRVNVAEDGRVHAQQRLPDGWVRMSKMEKGAETPFKTYCPTCAEEL